MPLDPTQVEQFAEQVVRDLRRAGFQALWAGGCVRDRLLGRTPKDFDVATNAQPDQVRSVFGRRRTLLVGAAFGVVSVLGPRGAGQVEVATFRRDLGYSDGRHPDQVAFCDAREDALRRDFTINGMFYDPVERQVLDFVGGQLDLAAGRIRAIGDPRQRFAEDKLRMVRAVRFATTFGFEIDPSTFAAIRQSAGELLVVSAERIAQELSRTLSHPRRSRGVELLQETGLVAALLPEWIDVASAEASRRILDELGESAEFGQALAGWLRPLYERDGAAVIARICRRWKLSNADADLTLFCLDHERLVRNALSLPWPVVQRVLVRDQAPALLHYAGAVARALGDAPAHQQFCQEKLNLPVGELNPPMLLTGDDLKQLGFPPGPRYRPLLDAVRNAQLRHEIRSADEARELAKSLWATGAGPPEPTN